jgi:hypothetical protein
LKTSDAVEKSKWEDFNHLREIFSKRKIPERHFRPTRIHSILRERESRFQDIMSVVWGDDGKFLKNVPPEHLKELTEELRLLERMANYYAEYHREELERLKEFGRLVNDWAYKTREQYELSGN